MDIKGPNFPKVPTYVVSNQHKKHLQHDGRWNAACWSLFQGDTENCNKAIITYSNSGQRFGTLAEQGLSILPITY